MEDRQGGFGLIGLHERESGAWHLQVLAVQGANKATRKSGFTGTQIAVQKNQDRLVQFRAQPSREARCRRFIGAVKTKSAFCHICFYPIFQERIGFKLVAIMLRLKRAGLFNAQIIGLVSR